MKIWRFRTLILFNPKSLRYNKYSLKIIYVKE